MAAKSVKQQLIDELEAAFELNADEQDRPVLSFVEFVTLVNPRFKWSEMSYRLAAVLQRVADGLLKRLMVFMPPRHGKSELISRMFSAYYLYLHPEKWVGINSYGSELAYGMSRAARDNYQRAGGTVRDDAAAVKHWETPEGGGYWAAGVGGPITGKGFSLGIIDDPLKNHEEASSETIREKQKDWYDSTFYTRAEEDAAIIILQTRWHEDDLSGWLLSKEYEDEPEQWHIVCMEALKEEYPPEFPPSCTIEPDWRQPGEALNPIRRTRQWLEKASKRLKNVFWLALYQQRPRPADGNTFKESWFKYYPRLPDRFEQLLISVDATFKGTKSSDFVVIQLWGVNFPDFYLIHQRRERMGFVATKEAIRQMLDYCQDEFMVLPSATLIEDKANGPAIMDEMRQEIPGIIPIEPQGSKEARAEAVSPYYQSGNVWLPAKEISPFSVKDYCDEFLSFPNGATDDQVDGSSQLIHWIIQRRRHKRQHHAPRTQRNW